MKAIILAGGKATRLPQSAKNIPKSLVEIKTMAVLEHQLNWLQEHNIKDVRLALGFGASKIINHLKERCEYVIEPEPLGTGGAIKYASQDIKEEFMVINGDILTDLDISQFIKNFKKSCFQNMIVVHQVSNPKDFGLVRIKSNEVVEFLEKPKAEVFENQENKFINAGIYIFSPDVFKNIQKKVFLVEREVFPALALQGKLGAFIHRAFWYDMGTEERLKEVRKLYKP